MPKADVLAVGCPTCKAAAGKACSVPGTALTTKIHQPRIAHALAVAKTPNPLKRITR